MYPLFSKKQVWNICLNYLKKDSPITGFTKTLQDFKKDFDVIFEQVLHEHRSVKSRYYRTSDKTPIVNPLYVEHYARLMYYFSHRLFCKEVDKIILDQIFLSIKTRCCIDLFYEINLKNYFMPFHALATVLGRAQYSDFLVVTQNCTIGNNKGIYPSLGRRVILRPSSMVLGKCVIGDNVQIAAGSIVIDTDIPSNSIVFGRPPNLIIKENKADNLSFFFEIA